jgi:uncharacterized membrane protein
VSPDHRRRWLIALVVMLSACCAALAHYALVEARSPTLGALLSLLPILGIGIVAARRSKRREPVLWAIAIGAIALWLGWGLLERNFANLFFLEHAGVNLILAIAFGRTLVGGAEPLCTRFARLLHGALEPDVVRYTRQVTLAWTIFFASLFILSCALYFGGFRAAWSLLANIANPLLLVLMFVIEYAIRVRVLPDHARIGILGGIRAFSRHFGNARFEAPR